MMALFFDQIIMKFPQKAFPAIEGKIDYHTFHDLGTLIYGNVSNLITTLYGGFHKHIWLVVQDMLYAKISPMPYDKPMNPGGRTTPLLQAPTSQRFPLQYEHPE